VPVTTPVQIRFSDLDILGHVSNAAYYELMESGRIGFFRTMSVEWGRMVIAHSECDHLAEVPGHVRDVDVAVRVEKVGRTSFTLVHEIRVGDQLAAVGRTVHVVCGEDTRPRPLTEAEKARLAEEQSA
jgi:acyl-CoA thioester hydrolase